MRLSDGSPVVSAHRILFLHKRRAAGLGRQREVVCSAQLGGDPRIFSTVGGNGIKSLCIQDACNSCAIANSSAASIELLRHMMHWACSVSNQRAEDADAAHSLVVSHQVILKQPFLRQTLMLPPRLRSLSLCLCPSAHPGRGRFGLP